MKYKKEIKTTTTWIRLREDNILEVRTDEDGPEISNQAIGEEIVQAVLDVSAGNVLPILVFMNDRQKGKEERHYYTQVDPIVSRVALVVSKPIHRLVGNFFIGINKLTMPVRLFSDEELAIKWLQ